MALGPQFVFGEFLEAYSRSAVRFVQEVYSVTPQPWQREVLEQYDKSVRGISIRSGHGVGKSTCLAWIMVHHLLCRFPQKTVVTAPTADQLWDALWAEFRSWVKRLPLPLQDMIELKSDRAELKAAPSESFVSARTSRQESPDALQGVHSGDQDGPGYVLLVVDEAAGVPDAIYEAAGGSMSGYNATTILAGNPTRDKGYFYDTHHKLKDLWWTRRVPCSESPYAAPQYEEMIRRRYGDRSNVYRVRILGEFPTSETDAVIPFDLILESVGREITVPKTTPVVWGLDCARFGDDRSALAKRQGPVLLGRVQTWTQKDLMQLAALVAEEYRSTPPWLKPVEINVDTIGLGAGVVDRLRQLGLPARGVNVAETPSTLGQEHYANLRAELWWKLREWFERRDCTLPESYRHRQDGQDLLKELSTPKYHFRSQTGKLVVEAKDEIKRRLTDSSPDLADAVVLTMASDAITLLHGTFQNTSWNAPLHRNLSLV